jgi:hypothetical protein
MAYKVAIVGATGGSDGQEKCEAVFRPAARPQKRGIQLGL